MGTPSPVAVALQSSFEREFLPLLTPLGFAPGKLKNRKPTLVVALATRALTETRRLEATLWCDGARGSNLRFRFDVVEPINGVECTRQLDLKVPWPNPGHPKPASLDFSGGSFRPEESPDRLATAVTFLAGAFAASLPGFAGELPELAGPLQAASASPRWKQAVERARQMWERRA